MSTILDPESYEIAVYDWEYLPQQPQPRPRHIIDAPKGDTWSQYYTPYCGPYMQAEWEPFDHGEAPQYGSTITNIYQTRQPIQNQLGSGAAAIPTAAPTAGAYTGIATSSCGPAGISGNPF